MPTLEPIYIEDMEDIEKIQKRAVKLVIALKNLPYKKHLIQLNLPT